MTHPQAPTHADGNLPAARNRLDHAISALIDPQRVQLDHGHTWLDPLLTQLYDAVGGQSVEAKSGGPARSVIWSDAFDLAHKIDRAVAKWCPQRPPAHETADPYPPTRWRLQVLAERKWRPQDTQHVTDIAAQLEEHALRIETLLSPEPAKYLNAPNTSEPAACTNCGTQRVWRKDPTNPTGRVMQPALKITFTPDGPGCYCQNCKTNWNPGQLRILAAALGYPLPAGVLE